MCFYFDCRKYHKRHKRRIATPPLTVETGDSKHLQSKAFFWFGIFLEFYQTGTAFLLTVVTWNVYSIEGVEVVTYNNSLSLLFSVIGIVVILYTLNRIKNKKKYVRYG